MKIVLDTNFLLVIVPKKSQFRIIFDHILSGQLHLVVPKEILLEYEEQLSNFYAPHYANLIINAIINLPETLQVNPIYFNWLLINNDVDDNKFVDAYIGGMAEYLVTNDKHFLQLSSIEFPRVNCIRIENFIQLHQ